MIATILLSFGMLFLAELGDKSQLMALTFTLRYRWWVVLIGISVASVVVNLLGAGVGHVLGTALPTRVIALCTGLVLLAVGAWTLYDNRPGHESGDEEIPAERPGRGLVVVFSAFLIAELGDRTMFATLALASGHNWVAVWIGAVLGMVAAGGLAIAIGATVGRHLPERLIAIGSGLLFGYLGFDTLLTALVSDLNRPTGLALALVVPVLAGGALWLADRRSSGRVDTEELTAAMDEFEDGFAQSAQSVQVAGCDARGDHRADRGHQGGAGETLR
ncbi:TMEM165/GDT1 family protein [Nocardia sp. BMG111209]|uniref:TMEM165/GDT1 family protein n=1 Tax=Nocardia sp. BMG111209 TaxID=1160137 RepID=UPI00035E5C86